MEFLSKFALFAADNTGFLVATAVGGGVLAHVMCASDPVGKYTAAIATNLELVGALDSLEQALPHPQLLTKLITLCDALCRLEFEHVQGARYRAIELSRAIRVELKTFRAIPWMEDDMDDFEQACLVAIDGVLNNIHHELSSR